MADQTILLPTGQKLDSSELLVAGQTVQRERDVTADPTDPLGLARVQNAPPAATDYAAAVRPIGNVPGGDVADVPTALAILGRVSDTVEAYLDNTVRLLSLTTDGRLRVSTASESTNFVPWGDPFSLFASPSAGAPLAAW